MLAGAGAQRRATGTRTLGRDQAPSPGGVGAKGALCWESDVAAESVEDATCPTHQRRNTKQDLTRLKSQ